MSDKYYKYIYNLISDRYFKDSDAIRRAKDDLETVLDTKIFLAALNVL
jgi:hypothetical protein